MNLGTRIAVTCLRFSGKAIFINAILLLTTSVYSQECLVPCSTHPLISSGNNAFPEHVFWGDTHLHTSLSSWDAYAWGNRLHPDEAYRFAKGETVIDTNGRPAKLERPLDFLVIADHAEDLGVMHEVEKLTDLAKDLPAEHLKRLQSYQQEFEKFRPSLEIPTNQIDFKIYAEANTGELVSDKKFQTRVWHQVTALADKYNEPGVFTAFIGYEWTSGPQGGNLHRNVIFKDDASLTNQIIPFSRYDSENPEDLWAFMANYEEKTNGSVLAIPHNGNTSLGGMFALTRLDGTPITYRYASLRNRFEPVYEIAQVKGVSEAHPFLSPTDEFANYEIWNSWLGEELFPGRNWDDQERERKNGEYYRSALKRGLQIEKELGVNPFKLGAVAGTDSHVSLAAVEENNFQGKFAANALGEVRIGDDMTAGTKAETDKASWSSFGVDRVMPPARKLAASGYTAVWALENSRKAIFEALQRGETYGTTGSRMVVRFFGGWAYEKEDTESSQLVSQGYKKGVPMGGDLTRNSTFTTSNNSPTFLLNALKDPMGANLDRIQVIKGWLLEDGSTKEKVYDVALSDESRRDIGGNITPVGNTVNPQTATYTNSIGSSSLSTVWRDPDFNAEQPAFYYLRVLEIPTPRWSTYDAITQNLNLALDVPVIQQERAYTSPIWYIP
jgi:hypothetical protein